ncbi:hypothetical protein N8586_01745 [Verrucomicrobiales bacterium]|nr:hypothetical protein [Verrucomicrobiales bacterium]MDB4632542.1 hypothetical protein [bacterium]NCF85660.1 hypothetical protein [Verrucomicrobiaceae bacterium]NCF94985.1 hypothetical protein [Verrucomicrobiaceae bacterium]
MKRVFKRILLFQSLISMVFFAPLALSAEIMAGFAHLDITPPTGGQTTGYNNALVTDGIHDPTSAQMVVLEIDQ